MSYTRGLDLSGSLEGAGGIGGLLARSSGYSGGNWTSHAYYHADGNGNITCLVNGSQSVVASYRYDPFGNTLSQSGTLADANVYRFSSKEIHTNSLMYYYGYRFYDPSLQRWINRDPLGEEGSLVVRAGQRALYLVPELQTWGEENLFHFVKNDPLSRVDYLGLQMVGPPGSGLPSWGPPPQGPPWWKTHGYKSPWDCIKDCVAMSTGLGTIPGAIACGLSGPAGWAYIIGAVAGCTATCNGIDHY